jgi:hypothetical protein
VNDGVNIHASLQDGKIVDKFVVGSFKSGRNEPDVKVVNTIAKVDVVSPPKKRKRNKRKETAVENTPAVSLNSKSPAGAGGSGTSGSSQQSSLPKAKPSVSATANSPVPVPSQRANNGSNTSCLTQPRTNTVGQIAPQKQKISASGSSATNM